MQIAPYRTLSWHWLLQEIGISSLAFPCESRSSPAETRSHHPVRRGLHGMNLWICVQSLEVKNCRVETTEVIIADCHPRTEGTWKLNTQPQLRMSPPSPRSPTGRRCNNKPYSCFGVSYCRDASTAFFISTKLQKALVSRQFIFQDGVLFFHSNSTSSTSPIAHTPSFHTLMSLSHLSLCCHPLAASRQKQGTESLNVICETFKYPIQKLSTQQTKLWCLTKGPQGHRNFLWAERLDGQSTGL